MKIEGYVIHSSMVYCLRRMNVGEPELDEFRWFGENKKLPYTTSVRMWLASGVAKVQITIEDTGAYPKPRLLKFDVPNQKVKDHVRYWLQNFAPKSRFPKERDRKDIAWEKDLDRRLKVAGWSHGQKKMPSEVLDILMKEYEKQEAPDNKSDVVRFLIDVKLPKNDRPRVSRWLIDQFTNMWPDIVRWDLGYALSYHAVPEYQKEIERIVLNRKYGHHRECFCPALITSRHPDAANILVKALEDPTVCREAIEQLGKLKATEHATSIKRLLKSNDSQIRREAKKALKRMGMPVEIPPKPVHLIKKRPAKMKAGFEEWGENLEMDDMPKMLELLADVAGPKFDDRCVAEVLGVVEEMQADRTKIFKFSISLWNEFWLEIFMDDIDSPDVAIWGPEKLVKKFGLAWSKINPDR